MNPCDLGLGEFRLDSRQRALGKRGIVDVQVLIVADGLGEQGFFQMPPPPIGELEKQPARISILEPGQAFRGTVAVKCLYGSGDQREAAGIVHLAIPGLLRQHLSIDVGLALEEHVAEQEPEHSRAAYNSKKGRSVFSKKPPQHADPTPTRV